MITRFGFSNMLDHMLDKLSGGVADAQGNLQVTWPL